MKSLNRFGIKLKLANSHEIKNCLNSLVIGEFKYLKIFIIYIISTVFHNTVTSTLTPQNDIN